MELDITERCVDFLATLNTAGDGLWSDTAKAVDIHTLGLTVFEDEGDKWGELRVYFDTDTWDIDEDGLIYTDDAFLSELQNVLLRAGFNTDVDYSEQGMQGDDYVSLDVGAKFIDSFVD